MRKVKLIVSDFDGCLLDLKELHYQALNQALFDVDEKYVITPEEHIKIFDGLSTKRKLQILSQTKNFPLDKIEEVNSLKQTYTYQLLDNFTNFNTSIVNTIKLLKEEGYLFYIASNAIKETVIRGLRSLKILDLVDHIIANEEVKQQKPHPEIYLKAMIHAGAAPDETLIIEDSKHGREAAVRSGALVCSVDNSFDFTYQRIKEHLNLAQNFSASVKWVSKTDTVVLLPMAGAGSRFAQAGYQLPKPLIDVNGKPMIKQVVDNLNIDAQYVFVVQKAHFQQYYLGTILPLIVPNCKIVQVDGLTQGAACTTLLAKEFINSDKHLLIANSDQFVEWEASDFMYHALACDLDGDILCFENNDKSTKWSYAAINELGFVTQVAEKQPISNLATVGIYWYKHGSDYVKYAEQMIEKNIRVNNEFYVAPIYNEMILDNKKVKTYNCQKMWGLGTPEDLEIFKSSFKK